MRLQQVYRGRARYYPDHRSGPHRLFVAVACLVEGLSTPVYALLDTASEWCVLPSGIAGDLGFDLTPGRHPIAFHTRWGLVTGRLERIGLSFVAEEGDSLEMEASCFISADWHGPMVIGWKGCLEWIRFAFDPGEDHFYFAGL